VIVGSTHPQVSLTPTAVEQLNTLPRSQAEAVARAIVTIGPGAGTSLQIAPPTMPTGRYFAVVPADIEAPVVIFRCRGYPGGPRPGLWPGRFP
jgi:hypothetical protein